MWIYVQKTGEILRDSSHVGYGYSGRLDGKNNPAFQGVRETGPIPVGMYVIGQWVNTATHGPFVLPLMPDPENEMFGRSDFLIHGDSILNPGTASKGCIIASRMVREAISQSNDTLLQVIKDEVTQI